MESRRRSTVWLGLLAAALLGAGVTWGVLTLATGGRDVASTPGDVASLEAKVADLERALEAARAAPRPVQGLATPPAPAEDARRAALEKQLAETKRRLEEALAPRPAPGLVGTPGSVELPFPVRFAGGEESVLVTENDGSALVIALGQGSRAMGPPLPPMDLAEAARLLRSAREEDRRTAYTMLARATSPDALNLLEEALGTDGVGQFAPILMPRAAALKDRAWSAVQATGAPDTPIAGDNHTAWAPKGQDMGEVTIDLEYATAVRVDEVRIRETLNPGAVVKVLAFERGRGWDVLWEGVATVEEAPRWFVPPLRRTAWATTTIRLVLDTNRVHGWNEIDAVELVGDGLRQWARGAQASSSYADAN